MVILIVLCWCSSTQASLTTPLSSSELSALSWDMVSCKSLSQLHSHQLIHYMKSIPEREILSPHVNTSCFKIQYQVHSPPSLVWVPCCISVTEQIWRQFLYYTRLSQSQTILTLPLDENQSDSSWVRCTRGNGAIAKWAWSRIFRKWLWWNSWSMFYDSFSIKREQARPVLQFVFLLHLSRVVSDFTRKMCWCRQYQQDWV